MKNGKLKTTLNSEVYETMSGSKKICELAAAVGGWIPHGTGNASLEIKQESFLPKLVSCLSVLRVRILK